MIVRTTILSLVIGLLTTPGAVHTLATSSDGTTLEQACRTLRPALWVTVPIGTHPRTNAQGDEAFRALSQFLTSQRNANARIACLRSVQHLSVTVEDPQKRVMTASPYATDAGTIIRKILHSDPSAAVRVAAAKTLWGSTLPEDGLALLQSAEQDASPAVRSASFENMLWPARADIARSHDLASYDAAIKTALHSRNAQVVGGALIARASLHGLAADASIRPYAFDPRPTVRESAIDAYDDMGAFDSSIACFMESRLSDPNPDVRSSVLLRLFRMGDHAALPAIRNLAKSAPTAQERQEAEEYVRAFASQPDFTHGKCGPT